jgi:anti-sigma factor RsiW
MNEPTYNELKEKSWVEPLSAQEAAELKQYLGDNPDLQHDWEDDAALTTALNRLPNVPVSSNFTSRVMQAVQREEAQTERKAESWRAFWRFGWIPKFAMAIAMLCLGTFSFHEYQIASAAKLVKEVREVAEAAPIPHVDWLKDFETINQMGKVAIADDDLMMAKQ